jgi:hypothetical protein
MATAKKAGISEIYTLSDPETGEVRYVGKANNTQTRLKIHLRDSETRMTPVCCWIKSLRKRGLKPIATPILSTWDWERSEIELISEYRSCGARLLNLAEGGNQPLMTREQASKNGLTTANRLSSDPFKKRVWQMKRTLGNALLAGELSDYAKDCMRQAARIRPSMFGAWANV